PQLCSPRTDTTRRGGGVGYVPAPAPSLSTPAAAITGAVAACAPCAPCRSPAAMVSLRGPAQDPFQRRTRHGDALRRGIRTARGATPCGRGEYGPREGEAAGAVRPCVEGTGGGPGRCAGGPVTGPCGERAKG